MWLRVQCRHASLRRLSRATNPNFWSTSANYRMHLLNSICRNDYFSDKRQNRSLCASCRNTVMLSLPQSLTKRPGESSTRCSCPRFSCPRFSWSILSYLGRGTRRATSLCRRHISHDALSHTVAALDCKRHPISSHGYERARVLRIPFRDAIFL